MGVWNNIFNLLFIVYGKHPEMGLYLEQKVKECHNESRRSTQTIGISKLIKEKGCVKTKWLYFYLYRR
ncbi:hypothetical protein HMPREF1407_01482 [Helicobacter pylori GAM244Ai]|nr:hypothetical protein HMPREF1407_01482 [Helicobacter pylori GAM244Ai]